MARKYPTPRDLAGQTFGRWTVLCFSHTKRGNDTTKRFWACRCACGTERIVWQRSLTSGLSQSCGCYQKTQVAARNSRHGMSRTQEYRSWQEMRARCENPNARGYEHYGARGITVCPQWQCFPNFFSDMGKLPTNQHTLDRIDNDKGYCPENCRWATRSEQSNNRRVCIYITHNGETKTLAQWARHYGVNKETLRNRLRRGVSFGQAVCR